MKKKSKVLIDSFHLFQSLTGIRTYTTQLCDGVEQLNSKEVEYIIYPNWRWVNKTNGLRGKVNVFKKILNHFLYFFWKQCCLPLLILFKKVDIVIVTDYLLPYFKFGAKGIAVFHDTFYWELKGKYNPLWRVYFLKSVQMGLDKNTEIVVTTNYIADKVHKFVTKDHKLTVIYQAPQDLNLGFGEPFNTQKLGLPQGAKYFLHIGIFEERKNLKVLIKAFSLLLNEAEFEDFYLVLAGGRAVGVFHDAYNNIDQMIKSLGLENRVIMPGFVSNQYLGSVYENAFAYVFPSKEEGFGIPVIEAMNAKIPVIISNQPALVEVADNAALVFDADNETALYHQMLKLSNLEIRNDLIEKGKLRAKTFTKNAFVCEFESLIKEMAQ